MEAFLFAHQQAVVKVAEYAGALLAFVVFGLPFFIAYKYVNKIRVAA